MSRRVILFIILLILNLLIVFIYLIWNHLRRKEKNLSTWMKAVVMTLCPIIGPAFLLVSFLLYKILFKNALDLSDVVFSKERVETFVHPDEDVEKNTVSLEEALEITDKRNLRAFIMNVIRGDYKHSLSSIALALNSEDTETAHYAASIMQDVLNEFRANVHGKYREIEEERKGENQKEEGEEGKEKGHEKEEEHWVQHCIELVEYMNPIVEQKVLTDIEQKSMAEMMADVLEMAWEEEPKKIGSTVYEKVCQRLLEVEDYERCKTWCERTKVQYPQMLSSYTCQLKLFFSCEDRENFFRVMQELKESDITIDSETLELIRIFM